MTANEALLQALLKRDKAMDDWTTEEYIALLSIMEAAHTEALGHISTLWQQGDIAEIKAQLDTVYSDAVAEIKAVMNTDLPALAEEEGSFIRVLLGQVSGLTIKPASIIWSDISAYPIAGSTLSDYADALGVNNVTDVVAETQRALEQGETLDKLVSTLRGKVVTRAMWVNGKYVPGTYDGGVMTTDTRQTEMFARTAVMHVGNRARETYYKANEDIIKGYMWVGVLDTRACLECIVLDGKVFGVNEPRPAQPLHIDCRCVTLPVLKTYRELGVDIDELPAGVRASMDGAVPQYTTWRDVLEKADDKRLNAILGPTRAALYKGGMSGDAMVKDGRVLTLKELGK
ncbi:MAG: phage minor head protein [Rectinema sp.]